VNGGEALSLAWQIESSPLMAPQGQVAVAPLHIGTRALAHGGQPSGLGMEVVLSSRAQRTQNAAGCKQWGAEPLSACAPGFAITAAASPGHTIEIVRGDQLGVYGQGDRRRSIELSNLLSDIPRDERDGAWHFWHHPLGFVDTLSAALAEPCGLGNGANLLAVSLNIRGDELAVAAYPALEIDKVVGVANASDTRPDLCTLLRETLVLATGRVERLFGLLQPEGSFWGTP
jgi:hypothetical protein